MSGDYPYCDNCGHEFVMYDEVPSIILNRFYLHSGPSGAGTMHQVVGDDEYVFDPVTRRTSGVLLCYPKCLIAYLDLQIAQSDIEVEGL